MSNHHIQATAVAAAAFALTAFTARSASAQKLPPDSGPAIATVQQMIANENKPTKVETIPEGNGSSICSITRQFPESQTQVTRIMLDPNEDGLVGNIVGAISHKNDANRESKRDQTNLETLYDDKGKMTFRVAAYRDDDEVKICITPGGLKHNMCNQHPTIGTWITVKNPELAASFSQHGEEAVKQCLEKHDQIQDRKDAAHRLGSYDQNPPVRVKPSSK